MAGIDLKALARQMYEHECYNIALRPEWDAEPSPVQARYEGYAATALIALSAPDPDLENDPASLADANSKEPLSQDQEIAGLREEVRRKDEALRNVRGLIDTPVARRKHHNDPFYDDVIASLRTALSPLDGEA